MERPGHAPDQAEVGGEVGAVDNVWGEGPDLARLSSSLRGAGEENDDVVDGIYVAVAV